ncbi:MAG TPA: DNA-binding response regulator [Pseudomonas sp.]|jgi:two-component system capsular synthesis response regulator RcsB|nr:DNA-binding response regulator [Pseudomonas sp.]
MKRILLADDHPVVRTGLRSILSHVPEWTVVGEAADPAQLEDLLLLHPCELVITDLSMPFGQRPDGVRMLADIRRNHPRVRLLVVTSFGNLVVLRAVARLGVEGILEKTCALAVLTDAVGTVLAGGRYFSGDLGQRLKMPASAIGGLSARESEVVRLLAHGLSVKDIADIHRRTVSTISRQKGAAMKRLALKSDYELMLYAKSIGLSPSGS